MGCLEPRNGPHATPTPSHGFSPRPHSSSRQNSQPREVTGWPLQPPLHSVSQPRSPLHWPSLCPPPSCPHPHFWPELRRGNSSWQTQKAGMREIHKPDVLLWRGRMGDGEGKGRGAPRAPVPLQNLFGPRAEGPGGAALLPRDQAAQGSWTDM